MKFIILFLGVLLPVATAQIRVQLTTGGHPHDISFYSIFDGANDLAITVNPHPSTFHRPLRNVADVIVLYDLNDISTEKDRQNIRAFLEGGGGLVVLHHALANNWQWKWWYEEVVGGRYLIGADGPLPRSRFKVNVVLTARPVRMHPVLHGVGELRFEDEAYKGMWISEESQVLMETENPENDKPVVWIGPWRKSRVIAIQLGHGPGAYRDSGFRRLVSNAVLWAAGKLN